MSGIRVTTTDTESGESESQDVPRDGYVVVCAGRRYVSAENVFHGTGTIQLTLKLTPAERREPE